MENWDKTLFDHSKNCDVVSMYHISTLYDKKTVMSIMNWGCETINSVEYHTKSKL